MYTYVLIMNCLVSQYACFNYELLGCTNMHVSVIYYLFSQKKKIHAFSDHGMLSFVNTHVLAIGCFVSNHELLSFTNT